MCGSGGVFESCTIYLHDGRANRGCQLHKCGRRTFLHLGAPEISGVSYMCWIDFHNGIWGCGFLCARLIPVSFPATTPRATTPHRLFLATTPRATTPHRSIRLPQRGLPRPTALFPGYHARTHAIKLTGYHVCRVTTPELRRTTLQSNFWVQAGYRTCG